MTTLTHNRAIINATSAVNPQDAPETSTGTLCILLRDGRLIGPFATRSEAVYWATAQELDAFSTYDLIAPINAEAK